MSRGPLIAVRDCLTEITVLHDIAARMTPDAFRDDPVARRAAAYAVGNSGPVRPNTARNHATASCG